MTRIVTVGAAQLGPIQREHTRKDVVVRLLDLLHQGHDHGCDLVVFPELALTTFFPRWFVDDRAEADHYYERAMPNTDVQPLFDEARRLGVGFCLGYVAGRACGLSQRDSRTVAIEVGMQNGGLAATLAGNMGKAGTMGLAPVLFATIMNVTGSALAGYWARRPADAASLTTYPPARSEP